MTELQHRPAVKPGSMDFAPDTPTTGYERYVSESESTDGEGDVSGGQQRRKLKLSGPGGAAEHRLDNAGYQPHHHHHHHDLDRHAPSSGYQHGKSSSSASSSSSSSSIFSRLAASWKKGSESAARAKEASCNGSAGFHHHGNYRAGLVAAPGAGEAAGWRDIREGSPRAGDGGDDRSGGVGGSSATAAAAAAAAGVGAVRDVLAAGVSSMGKSSSGLKGLKTSLLAEDGDTAAQAHPDHPVAGAHQGGRRAERARDGDGGAAADGPGGGVQRGRGLWDEAAAGDLDALAAALSPNGDGDVHARNLDGWTALHSAAHAGHGPGVISLLVRCGASTAAAARRGYTPLHSACMRGRWHAARALLAFGADANARAEDQRTPLHFACEAGSPECVKELLQASASPNVSDEDARTPLHFACIDGSTECVRRLLAAGASHFPPDAWGRDPAAVARQLDRAGPLRLLEAAAAAAAAGGGRKSNGDSARGVSSALPAASARGGDGGDVSGGDSGIAIAGVDGGGEGGGQLERGSELREAGGESAAAAVVVGKRWVVMNESGRMLERRSGKVALFKSMAAAVDWANGLEITSGSFQVAEVAPAMRRAFEREVAFEMTGGGTVSEEEEEEKADPQWSRYRRQQAAARKGAGSGSGGGGRKRRGAWTAAAQRRDEDEARAMVAATASKLRDVSEEADMHRQKAASLERALEAVLKECDELAAAAAAASAGGSQAGTETEAEAGAGAGAGPQDFTSEAGGPVSELSGADTVEDDGDEGEEEGEESEKDEEAESGDVRHQAGSSSAAADTAAAAAAAPSLLLGIVDDDDDDPADAAGTPSLLLGVDDPPQRARSPPPPHGEQDKGPGREEGSPAASAAPSLLIGVDDPPQEPTPTPGAVAVVDGGSEQGGSEDGGPSLLEFENGRSGDDMTTSAPAANGGVTRGDGDGDGDGKDNDGGSVDSEDSEEAAVERLAAWLMGLKIRKTDAALYARSLVDDGFDSGEALRGVREEELVQYGMKKGHARFVVTSLAAGFGL
eukprot:g13175.t1